MEMQLRLVIHRKKSVYDDLLLSTRCVTRWEKRSNTFNDDTFEKSTFHEPFTIVPRFLNNRRIDSHAVSAYVYNLIHSNVYRSCALQTLLSYCQSKVPKNKFPVIFIKLKTPNRQFLDYRWGERMAHMVLERCEVEHAMSWLSTLGGAFSALGENVEHCAQMAGKISVHQFRLALRLGNPVLEARCKLYAALSIIQQGNLKVPKRMIQDIFKFAKDEKDIHLQRMCQGVWAKLKYCYKLRKLQKMQRII